MSHTHFIHVSDMMRKTSPKLITIVADIKYFKSRGFTFGFSDKSG